METELYKKYSSLRKVSQETGIPVSTLWYRLSKKGVLNKKIKVTKIHENSNLLTGLYIGLWAGDGSRYYDKGFISKIHINKNDADLISLIQEVVYRLFRKKVRLYLDGSNDNRASVKIHSKFIFHFPEQFLNFSKDKSKTVRLKNITNKKFLEGFLLGLTLTDGYLKKKFVFVSVSKLLAKQVSRLLKAHGFSPKTYVHIRRKWNWSDLHMVRLKNEESKQLKYKLNVFLKKLGISKTLNELKRYEEK